MFQMSWTNSPWRVEPLNALLDEMSGEHRAELWTASALRAASEWERVRSLAKATFVSFQREKYTLTLPQLWLMFWRGLATGTEVVELAPTVFRSPMG